jgi:amidase
MKRAFLVVIVMAMAIFVRPAPADENRNGKRRLQLVEATIEELQDALRSRLVTSEQLVEMYLARIAAYDDAGPNLNSYIHVNEVAVDVARVRDFERRHGRRGPLFGIPISLKDNINTDDMPTTAGSVALAGSIPPEDATITKKLRRAGAIILGKNTLTEFANFIAIGMPAGYSSLGGYGLNPFDPRPLPGGDGRPVLTPGGSSSGPGIASSANLAAVTIGTETSGSILSPSSSNGNVGIKPTVGLVSRFGILPITGAQDTAGPITRTVTDAAIVLGVIAGFDLRDLATLPCLFPGRCFSDYTRFLKRNSLRGARIAVPHVPYWNGFTPEQAQIMNNAIAALRAEGAFVDDPHEIPNQADISAFGICTSVPAPATCSTVFLYDQKHDLNSYLALRPDAPVDTISDIIAFNNANASVALKYGQALFLAADALDDSPGSADTARFRADRAKDIELTRGGLDAVFNGPDGRAGTRDDFDAILFPQNRGAAAPAKAGYPTVVVPGDLLPPVAPVVNPAPFGISFTGRAFSEPKLIGIAYAFEQATRHRVAPASTPPLPSDLVERDRRHGDDDDLDGDDNDD